MNFSFSLIIETLESYFPNLTSVGFPLLDMSLSMSHPLNTMIHCAHLKISVSKCVNGRGQSRDYEYLWDHFQSLRALEKNVFRNTKTYRKRFWRYVYKDFVPSDGYRIVVVILNRSLLLTNINCWKIDTGVYLCQ